MYSIFVCLNILMLYLEKRKRNLLTKILPTQDYVFMSTQSFLFPVLQTPTASIGAEQRQTE